MRGRDDSATEAEAVLAALRADLRRGDFARLEDHVRRLEAAMARLDAVPGPVLARLRRAAVGNAACLAAAAQGLRAAKRRLAEIGSARRGEAYDASGQRRALGSGGRRLTVPSNAAEFPPGHQERLNPRRF